MVYISETEARLDLLDWPDVKELTALKARVAALHGVAAEDQVVQSAADFLSAITAMADPADSVMMDYARNYTELFRLLETRCPEIVLLRAGKGTVQIYIMATGGEETLLLHTVAIET